MTAAPGPQQPDEAPDLMGNLRRSLERVAARPAAPSVQPDRLAEEASRAVSRRLGRPMPSAVLGVDPDGTDVLVRLNSGGNASAVREHLTGLGHEVSVEGCAVRVRGIPAQPDRLPCDACGNPSTWTSTPGGIRFCDDHGTRR